jgi:hypothetical protein
MKEKFEIIRNALEEHLSAINENTSEIQAMFDYLQELEIKVDKLSHRLDNLQLNNDVEIDKPVIQPLDHIERKVFLVLYTEDMPLSCRELGMKARVPLSAVSECISSITDKGIPLLRSLVNNQIYFKLSPSFKEIQAKENLINLSLHSFM